MAKLSRLISRGALVLMLLVSLLCSAGCGCGGGSAGPPAPDYDRDYYPHGINPPGLHPGYPYEPYYPEKIITRAGQYLVREARLTGASFIEDAEHSRVTMAATDGLEEFGRAYYLPQAVAGWPAEADVTTTAYAIYSFGSAGFNAPVYIETDWAALVPGEEDWPPPALARRVRQPRAALPMAALASRDLAAGLARRACRAHHVPAALFSGEDGEPLFRRSARR